MKEERIGNPALALENGLIGAVVGGADDTLSRMARIQF